VSARAARCALLGAALFAAAAVRVGAQPVKQPVYLGVRACARCHEAEAAGNQYGHWLGTAHAKAWAALATPEARAIARLSGITDEPQRAPVCLGCHATAADAEPWERDAGFRVEDGVQCEMCHGPGSEYADDAVMRDPEAARRAGLRKFTKRDCQVCHYVKGSHASIHHKPPLDVEAAWRVLAHPVPGVGRAVAAQPLPASDTPPLDGRPSAAAIETAGEVLAELAVRYKNPVNLAFRPDGREVWAACEASGSVVVVDAARRLKLAEIEVGGHATGLVFSPDGARAYVTSRLRDEVVEIDVARRVVLRRFPVADEPHGVALDPSGRTLFVMGTAQDAVSVVDVASGRETLRLAASRSPWAAALSPDGTRLLVTNALSRFVPFRTPPLSEVTVLDVASRRVVERWAVPEANLLLGVAWHPSGRFALATLNRTKNLLPMTRILQGWTITNGLAVLWRDGRVDQLLLDEPQRYFADVTDVAFTPDGRRALVTSAGTDQVAVLDVEKLVALVERSSDADRRELLPNWLGASDSFVVARVPVGRNPRAVAVAPDGASAWVASTLDDSLSVIDLAHGAPLARVDLGGAKERTRIRWGEQLFHSARITFQRQFACATCHPDGHVDGLTYDIEADGLGVSPVDNRTLRGIYDTDPFKWEGTNVTLARQCGARLAVFFTRIAPFTPEELAALNQYTVTIPRPPNRHRAPGAPLGEAQRRGKRLFERTLTNDGREIPPEGRCSFCHFGPYHTDRTRHDVGTRHASDRQGEFDVPHLNNIYDSAPYLHDGSASTLEEIWTVHNPNDRHGRTNDMTKDQLNDLIEYLKTL
jgi:DNA-binding beta-propeller fold protein YncE